MKAYLQPDEEFSKTYTVASTIIQFGWLLDPNAHSYSEFEKYTIFIFDVSFKVICSWENLCLILCHFGIITKKFYKDSYKSGD